MGVRLHVVMGVRLHRVPEEHEHVDPAVRNTGPGLLIPAERTAVKSRYRQAELLAEHPARCPGPVALMTGEQVAVELRPLAHVLLAPVVRDKRDPPLTPGLGARVVE
jgi:hypothetical protein